MSEREKREAERTVKMTGRGTALGGRLRGLKFSPRSTTEEMSSKYPKIRDMVDRAMGNDVMGELNN